jgi:MFS family permease
MIFAPLFGYLGDRYNRKVILCIGLSIWCFATFAGSFATNFWLFLFFRAVVIKHLSINKNQH